MTHKTELLKEWLGTKTETYAALRYTMSLHNPANVDASRRFPW